MRGFLRSNQFRIVDKFKEIRDAAIYDLISLTTLRHLESLEVEATYCSQWILPTKTTKCGLLPLMPRDLQAELDTAGANMWDTLSDIRKLAKEIELSLGATAEGDRVSGPMDGWVG